MVSKGRPWRLIHRVVKPNQVAPSTSHALLETNSTSVLSAAMWRATSPYATGMVLNWRTPSTEIT
ncbi:hypothetical protein D9M68_858660 [compost metagenome]